ncbi:response regulator transcription factor [Paenibacillus aestuarii]|uniref:Response regulator n=1 Tax=Paenibacillus aestuarii TaxID=516965 RepID=A0ABW0KEJ6_9BACL|nr:response regulator [Paenibacillus aestuarii]
MVNGKVLIVEDQIHFRKGLIKMIESGSLGWDVVGEASNGQDALVQLDQVKPDLVLTDIRMPIMDGIEFVGHLRKSYPELLVVILTGYKNFEYAQAAVRHGALDLLIKPCTEQDVRQVLSKASGQFYARLSQQHKALGQQWLEQDQALRAICLDLPYAPSMTSELNALLAGSELWLLQLNHEDFIKRDHQKGDRSLLQFALSNIVEELTAQAGLKVRLLLVEHDRFVLMAERSGVPESLKVQVEQAVKQYLNIRLHMIPMGLLASIEQLAERYGTVLDAARERTDAVMPQAVESHAIPDMLWSLNQARVNELEVQLMSAILIGQSDRVQQLLEQMLTELGHKSLEEVKVQGMALTIALNKLIQKQFDPDGGEAMVSISSDMPHSDWSQEQVISWANRQVKSFMLQFNHWQASKSDNVIEKAVLYIEQHYHEECRLTEVAMHVHLNPSYFSALFKKAKGESFTSFVTRYRLEKAALLLRNTDMKIFEIASSVGFDEPNYFTNVFKQRFRMSPKEYRSRETL